MLVDRPVLVVTQLDDPTANRVVATLHQRGVPVVRFDTSDFPTRLSFSWTCGGGEGSDGGVGGWLRTTYRRVNLSTVRSLYYRRPSAFVLPTPEGPGHTFATLQARYGLGGVLNSLPGCLYVNNPLRIADAEFKPIQLMVARSVGFKIPPTIVSNDLAAIREFAAQVGRFVYKPLRLTPYTEQGEPMTVWVEDVEASDLDTTVEHTAHMFQALVSKTADIRVTVFGTQVFAIRIEGREIDWRYDYDALSYTVIESPESVVRATRAYLRYFGLTFGAFDFALDQHDDWIFLECNPNGQYLWLEISTGLPMTSALADLLQGGANADR